MYVSAVHVSPMCLGFRSLSFGFSFRGGLCVPPASVYPSYVIYEISDGEKKKKIYISPFFLLLFDDKQLIGYAEQS